MLNKKIENNPNTVVDTSNDIVSLTRAGQKFLLKSRLSYLKNKFIYPKSKRLLLTYIYDRFVKTSFYKFFIPENYLVSENFFIKKKFYFLFNYTPTQKVFYRSGVKMKFHDKTIFNIFCQKFYKNF
jgi:hypothetical protein